MTDREAFNLWRERTFVPVGARVTAKSSPSLLDVEIAQRIENIVSKSGGSRIDAMNAFFKSDPGLFDLWRAETFR